MRVLFFILIAAAAAAKTSLEQSVQEARNAFLNSTRALASLPTLDDGALEFDLRERLIARARGGYCSVDAFSSDGMTTQLTTLERFLMRNKFFNHWHVLNEEDCPIKRAIQAEKRRNLNDQLKRFRERWNSKHSTLPLWENAGWWKIVFCEEQQQSELQRVGFLHVPKYYSTPV